MNEISFAWLLWLLFGILIGLLIGVVIGVRAVKETNVEKECLELMEKNSLLKSQLKKLKKVSI